MKQLVAIWIALCLAVFTCPNFISHADSSNLYEVIEQSISVYESASIESTVVATLSYGKVVSLVNSQDKHDYSSSPLPHDELFAYLHIVFEQNETTVSGFVIEAFMMVSGQTENITIRLVPNATIKGNPSDQIPLFAKENLNYVMQESFLPGGTRVKIVGGYDSKNPYTEIEFEANNIRTILYVSTTRIKPDGVSPLTITALSVLLACLTIGAYSLLYSKRKKLV